MKVLLVYMPVLHAGYLQLIDEVQPNLVALISENVLRSLPSELEYVAKKDLIRAVSSDQMRPALGALQKVPVVHATLSNVIEFARDMVVMPDEDVSIAVAEKYFGGVDKVTLVTPPAPRLRYNRNNVEEKKLLVPDRRIALTELDKEMMALADGAAARSPDWYRQVGGVLRATDGRQIVAYNEHVPHEQIAATFGDPRSMFKSGVRTDLSLGDHVEHVLIGEAARMQFPTEGAWMYLKTFPCLPCARVTVRAGVKRLFYREPSYGLLDADKHLRLKRVELIEVSDD